MTLQRGPSYIIEPLYPLAVRIELSGAEWVRVGRQAGKVLIERVFRLRVEGPYRGSNHR